MTIKSKNEILETFRDSSRRVADWFSSVPTADFFTRQAEVWSASDNLDHLSKAVKPVTLAMKMPRLALQGMFGKPEKASRDYAEICETYRAALAKGAQASGRYLPDQENPGAQADELKNQLIEKWKKVSDELVAAAETWSEAELDEYQLPHPILGNLTVREMLFFSIYHSLRHASIEGD
jgi:hypothetical protein